MAQNVSSLVPILDEAQHLMALSCQCCGAIGGPVWVGEDGSDDVVLRVNIRHEPKCPLSIAGEPLMRMQ